MKNYIKKILTLGAIALPMLFTSASIARAADMQERIRDSVKILNRKQGSSEPIPAVLLNHAKGVAIFTLTKAGLGVGGQGGEGIVMVRLNGVISHSWSAPSAFNLGGASLGAQIGFTEVRYIVILNTDDAVKHFTSSEKINWDATATGTAGSDTGTEKVSTTDLARRDVIVYKDSGGIFGGATFGGTSIECKDEINRKEYGENVQLKDILNGKVQAPKSAGHLYRILDGKV